MKCAATLAVLLGFASTGQAQQKISLGKPNAETSESFTRIAAIRELPGGKVLVADPQDKVVDLVDFGSGSVTKVGREGSGPGEYALPFALLPLPDGSTLIQDLLNRRFLSVTPEGKPAGFLELPRPPTTGPNNGPGPGIVLGGMQMRGADAKGWLYFEGSPLLGGAPSTDSVPLLRWDRVHPKFDTLGYVKLPSGGMQASGGNGQFQVRMGAQKVFAPAESWAVAGDGRIARIQPNPYRVFWLEAGKVSAGPVQPYTPIRVTEADKELVREARKKNRGILVAFGPGGGSRTAPPGNVSLPEPEFEETMAPFEGGPGRGGSVLATPEGEVWVLRTRPASDKTPSYDVFDKTGALSKKVTLNPNSRVVGFGKGTVYVVRTDEDDLQYLQRYVRP
jgi:hypothetical protein